MNQPGAGRLENFDAVIALFEIGQADKAAEMCQRLLAQAPGDISLMNMLGVIAAQEGRFDEAAIQFRKVAEHAPDDPGVITNLAQALLECGDHAEALVRFRRAATDGDDNMRIFRNSDLGPENTHTDKPVIHTLDDVTMDTGYWAVLDGDRMYARDLSNLNMVNSPTIKGRITADREYAALAIPDIAMTVDAPCLFVGGDDNYAHWLYRYLMRLAALDNCRELASLPLLVGDDMRPYRSDALALTGFDRNEIIRVPRNSAVRCRQIHIPVCLWSTPARIAHGIKWLRDRVFVNMEKSAAAPTRRIFVSRRDAPNRHMTNEDEVIDALSPIGIERVELSSLTFAEQVMLFAETELVVAPHGAALANLIFAPTTCSTVELVSDPIAHMGDIRLIQQILGQRSTIVPCTSFELYPEATNPMVQHNFHTDPAAIVAAVEVLLTQDR